MKNEREDYLIEFLEKVDVSTINELAEVTGVSHSSIRRTFKKLEKQGEVELMYGGKVKKNITSTLELEYSNRLKENIGSRKSIDKKTRCFPSILMPLL